MGADRRSIRGPTTPPRLGRSPSASAWSRSSPSPIAF